jgi:hypothetical protein
MALPQRITELSPVAVAGTAPRIRRCTFRRLSRVDIAGRATYEVNCLYPDRRLPLPLGDLDSSSAVCAPCQADHVFRPDED